MRLLNTLTLRVENVAPDDKPDYAILSHRWTDEEVTFQEIATTKGKAKAGYTKITACCAAARDNGISHVWIDTCCIDKTSSTELSEAINSMFQWYRDAKICYAYLFDATTKSGMLDSEWFDRSWTLQELIAPKTVHFYAGDWSLLGGLATLSRSISDKTGISESFLHDAMLSDASIAERMSWAGKRKTTRPEDMSYCLLGIFNVQMPLIYGEGGEKAFRRLQLELLKQGIDSSWLAWGNPSHDV